MNDERYSYWMDRVAFLEVRLKIALKALKQINEEMGGSSFNSTHRTVREYFDLDSLILDLERHSNDDFRKEK